MLKVRPKVGFAFIKLYLVLFVVTAFGCVTTHYHAPQTIAHSQLNVSCANPRWLTGHFVAVSCTFENKTDHWVEIQSSDVTLSNESESPALTAEQTASFLKSYSFEQRQEEANTDLLLTGLLIGGTAAALSGHSSPGANIGAGAAIGSLGYGVARDIGRDVNNAQYPDYGADHILGPVANIPAGLFVRRSAIFEVKNNRDLIAGVEVCMTKPETECFVAKNSSSQYSARSRVAQ